MTMELLQEYSLHEFKGEFPEIPLASGVDLEELRAADGDPLFVTLPIIPEIGAISKNGLLYDQGFANMVMEQINNNRPGGIYGHIKDRDKEFNKAEALWVGAIQKGNSLWGKAYVPPGAARDDIRRKKAVGGKIATSVYGQADYEQVRPGVRRAAKFDLESIDFAPPQRAALGYGVTPHITAEMSNENNNLEDADMATKQEILAELTVNDLPESLRKQIISEFQATNDNKALVAELEQERDDAKTLVVTLQEQVQAYQTKEFETALDNTVAELIDWKIEDEAAKEKVNAFRRTVRGRILAELQDERDAEKVKAVAETVWEEMKPLAETLKLALSGGAAFVPGQSRNNGRTLEVTPEAIAAARGAMGL